MSRINELLGCTAIVIAVLAAFPAETLSRDTLYVDVSSTGSSSGTSWTDAFVDLEIALAAARPGDEIWVARGTYMLRDTTTATFQLRSEVRIYGGFAGTELRLDDRHPALHETILSGNDGIPKTFNVVTGSGTDRTAVLDGFTITKGSAGADFLGGKRQTSGAGLFILDGSPTLRNLVFRDNEALLGAAVAVYGGSPAFVSCTFVENLSRPGYFDGGAFGGAIYVGSGSVSVYNSRFLRNAARGRGSAYSRRTGFGKGGAVFIRSGEFYVFGSLFAENHVRGEPFTHVALYKGLAQGGAVFASPGSRISIINSTFADNRLEEVADVDRAGGGIYVEGATAVVRNSLFWGNDGEQIADTLAEVSYSIVEGGYAGTAVLDLDPGLEDDYRFGSGSPAIDHGLTSALPADSLDLDGDGDTAEPIPIDAFGNPRVVGASVDVGYFEHPGHELVNPANPEQTSPAFLIFPNPASNLLIAELKVEGSGDVSVSLYDMLGRRVLDIFDGRLSAGDVRSLTFPVEKLAAGAYFVILRQEGRVIEARPVTLVRH